MTPLARVVALRLHAAAAHGTDDERVQLARELEYLHAWNQAVRARAAAQRQAALDREAKRAGLANIDTNTPPI